MWTSTDDLPETHGKLMLNTPLAPYSWFRVGGLADALFLPADEDDLANFLKHLDPDIPVTPLGVGSNIIIRDGGIEGVVIRLMGKYWGDIEMLNASTLEARAGALDLAVAKEAAECGIGGLSFLSGIPGTLGGATRTNAGCYGRELKDILNLLYGVTRSGEEIILQGDLVDYGYPQIKLDYRHTDLPNDLIVTKLVLSGEPDEDPEKLKKEITAHQARRAETQPIKDKTSGSTFANPDPPGTDTPRSAWKLIDQAGCRGLKIGGAQVSEKHCNFLINTGDATADDLETLGETVRARVLEETGVELRWEVRRIGRPHPDHAPK